MLLKRACSIAAALLALVVLALPMAMVALALRVTPTGLVLYWSQRVGWGNRLFSMPKFRAMRIDTPLVAAPLLGNAAQHPTPIGSFLRKTSTNELPQLWCSQKEDMSFVNPRPALFGHDNLIAAHAAQNVHLLLPGLTGWNQVNGRDKLAIPNKGGAATLNISSVGASFSICAL